MNAAMAVIMKKREVTEMIQISTDTFSIVLIIFLILGVLIGTIITW